MGSRHNSIQLMLEFLKASFLVLYFTYYTLRTFMMMLSVILLSMLMILLSIVSVIRHLICGNNSNWFSELESHLRDTGLGQKVVFDDFNAGKTQLVSFDWSNNTGATDVKIDGSVLKGKSSFKMSGFTRGSYIIATAKNVSKNIGALMCSMTFLFPVVALYLCKSTIHQCMEYCCHVWADALSCYLELLDKLQKRICRTIGPSLATSLEPSAHCQNAASLGRSYSYYFGKCSSELAQLAPLPFCIRYSDRLHDFSVTIPKVTMISMTIECFPLIAPIECFPLTFG